MRLTAAAGIFAFTLIVFANGSQVQAQSLDINDIGDSSHAEVLESSKLDKEPDTKNEEKPKQTEYIVENGDSLSKIAENHKTTWVRVFNKNESIKHPDIINTGEKIVIPNAEEVLPDRPLPVNHTQVMPKEPAIASTKKNTTAKSSQSVSRGSSSGNTYSSGYCTWYAKNMRPDLPNNLGNANTWVSRAAAQGLATGSTPRVGAIGQQGMHVVYVQSVNGDGTVTISEMNYEGLYVVSSRTVPAGTFHYIY